MLEFVVIILAINIVYFPLRGDGTPSSEDSPTEYYECEQSFENYEDQEHEMRQPDETNLPINVKGLIIDEFADPKNMTFDEIRCCYYNILLHFYQNSSRESCTSYAMYHLTNKTTGMMNNNYARPYYLYLRSQISVGSDMRSPEQYCIDNADPDYILPDPSSSGFSFKGIMRKKGSNKNKGQQNDARVIILENVFGISALQALLTIYDSKKIDEFNKYYIEYEYMTHIVTTVDLNKNAQSPMQYCTHHYESNASLLERKPANNIKFNPLTNEYYLV